MVAANGASKQVAVRTPRMTLQSVTSGKLVKPLRIMVHGTDGVGKSTLAAGSPKPIFLGSEDGTSHLEVSRFPLPESFEDARDAVRTLTLEKHEFGTLVIDTLDWMEPLIWRHVCEQAKVASIEDVGGGFGKGYLAALDVWRMFANDLEQLQAKRSMHLIILAHSAIKLFKNPEGEDYERYVIKMNDKAAAQWREWVDGCYFANYETLAKKDARTKKVKGISTGARYLYTQRTAAYDAKDRLGLPEQVALDWSEFEAAWKAGQPADPVALEAACRKKAAELGGEVEKSSLDYLSRNAGNAVALAQLNTRLNAKLAELSEKQEQAAAQS